MSCYLSASVEIQYLKILPERGEGGRNMDTQMDKQVDEWMTELSEIECQPTNCISSVNSTCNYF